MIFSNIAKENNYPKQGIGKIFQGKHWEQIWLFIEFYFLLHPKHSIQKHDIDT